MALHHYLPQDRLRALAGQRGLAERATGAALFADISGFTALTEALARRHGERSGVEALTVTVSAVYDALIAEVERFGGSTVAFAGDAITCWFDTADDEATAAPASARAAQAAIAMQARMQSGSDAAAGDAATDGDSPLALKVSVAGGSARRFTVGDAAIQTLDVLAGATVAAAALADTLAQPGDILLDEATAERLHARTLERRTTASGRNFAVLDPAWRGPLADTPPRLLPPVVPPAPEVLRPWVLPFVSEREFAGQGLFVTDLRPVVALFLRFGGLGDAEGELDAAAAGRLDGWIRGAQQVLQRHGGVLLELTLGDKGSYVYAAFGAAQAHEDDTRRALMAALELRTLFDDGSPGTGAGIGLASGTLRVGGYGARTRQSFGAQGDAVNAAARLMMLARPGEILTSGRVRGAAARGFALQARAPIALKGKAEPMPVFALLGAQRQRAVRLQEPDFVLPMVGRDHIVQQLVLALEQAAAGRGAVWAVVAEAGLGKSRLLAEGVRLALRRGFVGYGGSAAGDGVHAPYRPWRGVWTALLDLEAATSPRLQVRAVEAAVQRMAPEHAEAWPLLGPVLGLEMADNGFTRALAPQDRKALLEALLVQMLAAAAQEAALDGGGVLLVLEDLHAADALSLDLLSAIALAVPALPLLLLLSQRPPEGEAEPDVAQRLAALPNDRSDAHTAPLMRIELPGLDATQAEQLIRAKLAAQFPERSASVPPALIERIVERAQGNPFCIEELLNHLHDRGLDPHRTEALQALDWPVSLRRLVLSRIDRLTPPQQMALKVASVIGRRFTLDELRACHPTNPGRPELLAEVQELARLGLTPQLHDGSESSFVFTHRVTLEVAYDSIAQASRLHLHERVGRYLEGGDGGTSGQHAPALAHHWARAERPDRAWPHLRRAAEQAAAGYANEEALGAFAQVLAWLPQEASGERIDILLRCEALHDLLGQHDKRRRVLDELDAWTGRPEGAATLHRRVALRRAALALDMGDFAAAAAGARSALEAAAAPGSPLAADPTHDIDALLLLARAMFSAGQAEQARAPLERALALARRSDQQGREARALTQLGLVEWQTGHYDDANALLQAALPAVQRSGDLRHELDILNNLGAVAQARARFGQAMAHYEQAQAIARRIGNRSGEATMLNNLGSASLTAGDFHRAALYIDRAVQIWSALNEPGRLGTALLNRAEAHRELGQYAAAQAMGERALALIRASGRRRTEATVLENLGRVAAAQGERARALETFEAALALARAIGLRAIEASTLLDIGRLHTAAGETTAARAPLEAAAALLAELGDPLGLLEVQAARADLVLGDGSQPAHARASAAGAELATVLPRILGPGDGEAALPMGLYLIAWRTLVACADPRASELLARAREVLRERAARIPDASVRRDYLQIAEHRALLAE